MLPLRIGDAKQLPLRNTLPPRLFDQPYMKNRCRITMAGVVEPPTKPGLGWEIDRNVLDNMAIRLEG
jgi:L-alanine-DL-glutamate epimerase-like enolase superfamily enzyme